jgi:DNA-directed RNA polymerase subunit H (RpoH/RPB5)
MEIYNSKELIQVIYNNVFKMFERRKYINKYDNKYLDDFISNKMIYIEEPIKLSINYINNDISNISTGSSLDEYCNNKTDYIKIIVANSFNKKVYDQIKKYNNVEIFFSNEFLEDIPDKDIIPEHILLNEEETKELLQVYKIENLSKIYSTDMMARYYNAKVNDIFKIKRYNINSGFSIIYRVVVKGSSNILFN